MNTTSNSSQAPSGMAGLAINNVFVTVDDVARTVDFYHGVLGLPITNDVEYEGNRWVTLSVPGQEPMALVVQNDGGLSMSDADRASLADLRAKGYLGGLILTVDDVDAAFEHVRASGADVLQEPSDQFYGTRDCAFRDPAGHLVRINAGPPRAS